MRDDSAPHDARSVGTRRREGTISFLDDLEQLGDGVTDGGDSGSLEVVDHSQQIPQYATGQGPEDGPPDVVDADSWREQDWQMEPDA
jgi:hypothetical protein